MKNFIKMLKDESGASAAEYALILAIVGTAIAAAAILLALMEGIIQSVANPTIARISSLVLMSAVQLLRPQGLFKGFAK